MGLFGRGGKKERDGDPQTSTTTTRIAEIDAATREKEKTSGKDKPSHPRCIRVTATRRTWGEGWEAVPAGIILLAILVGGVLAAAGGYLPNPFGG